MAETTPIAWARSTFNPWIGCTKVAPECDNCYAWALDVWLHAGEHWGPGAPRRRTAAANWRKPRLWNAAQQGLVEAGHAEPWLVFGGSMMDWADNEADQAWRDAYWDLIRETPALTWLLLTKRMPNVVRMLPAGFGAESYPNVWLGTTAGKQDRVNTDGMRLLDIDAAVHFLSIEPVLEEINIIPWLRRASDRPAWVIVGGESGRKARHCYVAWIRAIVRQCRMFGVPVFVKQMGAVVVDRNDAGLDGCDAGSWPLNADGSDREIDHEIHGFQENWQGADVRVRLRDRAGADPTEWPEDLRIQEFPT